MNKKEKQIIEIIKEDLSMNNHYDAKKYIIDNDEFIFNNDRSEKFKIEFQKLEIEIDWTPSLSYETSEYFEQENKLSDNPEIR